jgi:YesN/AraC family two-component response regulator
VAEVCERVGYGNISYFIRLFREVTGVTPAKYRRDVVEK